MVKLIRSRPYVLAIMLAQLTACASMPAIISRSQPQPCDAGLDKVATVGAIRLAYRQYGPVRGAPMLLIGGTGQQLIEWPESLIAALAARGYRVTVFDNRDVGCSTHMSSAGPPDYGPILAAMATGATPPTAYSLETEADDAAGLLDALGIRRAHIVGVSGGAIEGEIFAAKYPDRTLSLTAIAANSGNKAYPVPADPARFAGSPSAPPPNPSRDDLIAYRLATTGPLNSRTYPKPAAMLRAQAGVIIDRSYDPDAAGRQSVAALVTPDLRERLHTIKAPAVVIQGEEDPLIPLALAQDVAAAIPGARLVVIKGMGHDLPDEVTGELVGAISSVAKR